MSAEVAIRAVTDPAELQDVYAALLAPSFPPSPIGTAD